MAINLDNILGATKSQKTVLKESVQEKTVVSPKVNIDAILTEWSWRCKKGYPDFNNKSDMHQLQIVLEEMGVDNPFPIVEAEPAETSDTDLGTFTNMYVNNYSEWASMINKLYPKHGAGIAKAFKSYIPNRSTPLTADQLQTLNLFGTITDPSNLIATINSNANNTLFQSLFEISSVTGAAGGKAETSGRGGLGKGEVLCVLLLRDGASGGTSGADIEKPFKAEVKSETSPTFKVPLNAARVTRPKVQNEFRRIFSWISEVKDLDNGKMYTDFLESVNDLLPSGQKMTKLKNEDAYFRAESVANVNGQELTNLAKFFVGCKKKFSGAEANDEVYMDIDGPGAEDALVKAKLNKPEDVQNIKVDQEVSFTVLSKDVDEVKLFKSFENRLRRHDFVLSPDSFAAQLKTDAIAIVSQGFIVFKEPTAKGKYIDARYINGASPYNPRIQSFTLDQAVIKFDLK